MNYNLAIELGSSNTSVYKAGLGIVLREPSLIAVETKGKHKVLNCVGNAAKKLIGKHNSTIEIIEPIVAGEIVNFQLAKLMLNEFLKRIEVNKSIFKPRNKVVFCVPCGLTNKEKKNFKNLAFSLNLTCVSLLPCAIAGLIGMEIEPSDTQSHFIVNIGGGTTDMAIVNGTTIIRGCTIGVGGNNIDSAISKFLKEEHGVIISNTMSENIKFEIISLLRNDTSVISVNGLDVDTKNRKEITIFSHDIYPIVCEYFDKIAITIETMLNMSSSEVVNDITKCGIYVCGGTSGITGLDRYLKEKLCLPVYVDVDPDNTVMKGCGSLLNNPKLLNNIVC